MRILFIHEVNYRNKVIFEMHEFPELLAMQGHDVTFFHYPEFPDEPKRVWRTQREQISGRVHPGASLTLLTPPTLGGRGAERYLAPLLNAPALRKEIRGGRYDVIFLYSVPTTGWQAVSFARRARVPVVFRALDVSHQIRKSPLSGLIRMAEKYIYRNAALISANNPALLDYCVELSGREGPGEVNLPPIDLSHFEKGDGDGLRNELGIAPSDKVLLYMGSFFDFSGLDVVVKNLVSYFELHPSLHLVLVGGGALDASLRRLVMELDLSQRVTFTGVVPYSKLPDYLRIADVALNPFEPQLLTNVALPHKVLQYMAAGVPVVTTSLTGLRGVLGEDSGVTWVSETREIAGVATELAFQPSDQRARIARIQSDYVAATFSQAQSVASLEKTLASLL